jgi:hypothetical protein
MQLVAGKQSSLDFKHEVIGGKQVSFEIEQEAGRVKTEQLFEIKNAC